MKKIIVRNKNLYIHKCWDGQEILDMAISFWKLGVQFCFAVAASLLSALPKHESHLCFSLQQVIWLPGQGNSGFVGWETGTGE